MRLLSRRAFALLLAPGLVAAAALAPNQQRHRERPSRRRVDDTARAWYEELHPLAPVVGQGVDSTVASHSAVDFELPVGDDSLKLYIDVAYPFSGQDQPEDHCGDSVLTVNGQHLVDHHIEGPSTRRSLTATVPVLVESSTTGSNHSVVFSSTTLCPRQPSHDDGLPTVLEVTFFRLLEVDDVPLDLNVGFSVTNDNQHKRILGVIATPSPSFSEDDIVHGAEGSATVSAADEPWTIHDETYRFSVEDEIENLEELKEYLKLLRDSAKDPAELVQGLKRAEFWDLRNELEECSDSACLAKAIFQKYKERIHLAYLRLKGCVKGHCDKFASQLCSKKRQLSNLADAETPMKLPKEESCADLIQGAPSTGWKKYASRPDSKDYLRLKDEDDISDDSYEGYRHSLELLDPSDDPKRKIHVVIGIFASLLCLSCITTLVHRRCCSPRARADRAARREERRTLREYRCAARRKAWRDWWIQQRGRFHWCRRPKSTCDYEEKRALILAQEAVLEDAMQNEIRQLRTEHGILHDAFAAAEEGRSSPRRMMHRASRDSNGSETLPAYRSRSGSGRPPSYTEVAQSVSSYVFDGFSHYTPSEQELNPNEASDATPDSSVAALSPRNSSETLRTERSAL